jgi:hypothetical protein
MRDLFRSFEAEGADCLVIGGQASILYGAAQFTQDLDIWLRPAMAAVRALVRALAGLGARVHKLTPPLRLSTVRRGHGFHFIVPQRGEGDLYLDVMGRPPRVGGFARAWARAELMGTPWGRLRVVAVEDLVELKKTNRPGDYEVISRLARLRLVREPRPSSRLVAWALANAFVVEDLAAIVAAHASTIPRAARSDRAVAPLLHAAGRGRPPTHRELDQVERVLARRALTLQRAGRAYWRPLIDELRTLRAAGRLLEEGLAVERLLD